MKARSSSHQAAILRLTLPPLAAVLLFVAAMYYLILPATHEALLAQKRETLRAIVASAISLCERHYAAEQSGELSSAQARQLAAADLRALRYGETNKDYLWVIDHAPRMIVHPYRADLEGQDLAGHRDPDGIPLFTESVRLVDTQGEGFIHYRWQWQDDATRIVPKLSHVRGFAPWGWVVGSGIYLDDVEAEIARSSRQLLGISAGIAGVLALLVTLSLRQGLRSEALRVSAEESLKRSTARYQVLAQAAEEAVWLVGEGRVAAANRSACQLFACTEAELLGRDATSLFAAGYEEPPPGVPHESMLACSSGMIPALVTVSSASIMGRAARVLTARDLRSGSLPDGDERRRREAAESLLQESLLPALGWLQAAVPLARPAPVMPLSSTQEEAASTLRHQHRGSLLLAGPDGGIAGLVSAADLIRRAGPTIYTAMSAPVHRLDAASSLADAADALAVCPGHHLLIEPAPGTERGAPSLIHANDVLEALRHNPAVISTAIEKAAQEDLPELRQRMLLWLRTLVTLQVNAEVIAAESSRLADATLRRVIALTLAEMGEPPAAFEIIVVGSQGRREMMPGSDQDNALIHADGADPHWFREFSRQLVARYAAAGWPRCEGNMVCANERWCLPLSAWREQFSAWIAGGSPQALLEVATFFDFRPIQTDAPLSEALRAHTLEAVASREVFLHQLGQNTLDFRPPLGAFGGIRSDETHQGKLDIKACMVHFIAFARIEALRHGLPCTGTGERLRALAQNGHLPHTLAIDSLRAWRYLLGLRFQLRATPGADDRIDPDKLDSWELASLKRALGAISELQARLRHEQERHQ